MSEAKLYLYYLLSIFGKMYMWHALHLACVTCSMACGFNKTKRATTLKLGIQIQDIYTYIPP